MINITENKSPIEIRQELSKQGIKVERIYVNGVPIGICGSTNERDREAALKALKTAYSASGCDVQKMIATLNTVAIIEDNGFPDEIVTVCGCNVMLSYRDRAAYTMSGVEIANCRDCGTMPRDAEKVVLISRAENKLR